MKLVGIILCSNKQAKTKVVELSRLQEWVAQIFKQEALNIHKSEFNGTLNQMIKANY